MNAVVCSRCNCVVAVNGTVPPRCPDCGSTLGNARDFTRSLPIGFPLPDTIIQNVDEHPGRIGRYIVERELGSGGFGTVYLAKDEKLARHVAIKIPKRSRHDPHHKERFAREARNAAQLRHAGIVSVYNVEEEGDLVFIVSEYVAGLPLDKHLKQNEISFRTAASLVASIAWAVEYAHSQKIIHRDIKPSNIMIDAEGNPRLMDFGLAKREEADETITAPNQVIGTPAFMSPEQAWGKQGKTKNAEGEHKVDRRSDVYSLGAVLYQLLTRELPFRGEPQVVRRKLIEDEPKRPREINDKIPVDLERICQKAMAKEPADRYRTAGDLAADLERWLRGEPILARHVGPLERAVRWSRRNPVAAGLVTSIALLVTTTACFATAMYAMEHRAKTRLEDALLENREMLSMAYVKEAGRHLGPERVVDDYNPIKALPYLYAAMQIDDSNPARRDASRLRLGAALRSEPTIERVWSHHGTIVDGGVSPAGDCFFTAGNDGTTRLWPLSKGGAPISPLIHPNAAHARFSPDGKRLLTSCEDGAARLWDISHGQLVAGPLWNAEPVPGARTARSDLIAGFGATGQLFFTKQSRIIQVWEISTARKVGAPLLLPPTIKALFGDVQFVQGDRRLLVPRTDGAISIWDPKTGKESRLTEGTKTGAFVAVDGGTVAAMESAEAIALWNCDSGVRLIALRLEHSNRIAVLKFAPSHGFLAVGTIDGTVYLWNAKNWQLCWKRRAVSTRVYSLDFNSDSSLLATISGSGSGSEGVVCVLDVGTGRQVTESVGTVNQIIFAKWVPKSDALITGSVDGSIRLWRPRGDEPAFLLPHASDICCAAVSTDHRVVVTADVDGACCVTQCPAWHPSKPTDTTVVARLENYPIALAVTGDGSKIAIASRPSAISIRDVGTAKPLMVLDDGAPATRMRFSSDGRYLITISENGQRHARATGWDTRSGERVYQRELDLNGNLRSADLQVNAHLCAVAAGREVIVWDAQNGRPAGPVLTHDRNVQACRLSNDARHLVSGGSDGVARIWEVVSGKLVASTPKQSPSICSLELSADGERLAAGYFDGTARVWSTRDARPVTPSLAHGAPVTRCLLTADSRWLVTINGDVLFDPTSEVLVRAWDASTGEPLFVRPLTRLAGRFPQRPQQMSGDPWRLMTAFFAAAGSQLQLVTTGGLFATFDMAPDERSPTELLREVTVRSGIQLDSVGALSVVEPDRIVSSWESAKEKQK